MSQRTPYPLLSKHEIDGFFGLFVDNLVQLLLIVGLCGSLCGMHGEDAYLLYGRVLPGAAVSILFGNLFYAWQARRLALREHRGDVTALPYGINTPSLLVYVFFVMFPVYRETGDAELAWRMGLIACVGSGLIEFAGAFIAERVRRSTPRAALLTTLAGIAIGFISMTFALQIWQYAMISMLPLAIILATYFSKTKFPADIPGGLWAISLGTLLYWLLPASIVGADASAQTLAVAWQQRGLSWPYWAGGDVLRAVSLDENGASWIGYLAVMIPMGLFNLVGSLQNLESAEAAGDTYGTKSSLAVNGAGTIIAAFFGSCFPTTIYIGHPGWKELGARAGYSVLNGIAICLICFTGMLLFISELIPLEACVPIVLWIGVIITAQAFTASPSKHAPAVAIGLFPAIAAWGQTIMSGTFALVANQGENSAGGTTMQSILASTDPGGGLESQVSGFLIHGLNILQQGYIFTCMILAAISVSLIERQFVRAAVWSAIAAMLSYLGVIHAYQLQGNAVDFLFRGMTPDPAAALFPATNIALGYLLMSITFLLCRRLRSFGDLEKAAASASQAAKPHA